jgi:hypothetical protein
MTAITMVVRLLRYCVLDHREYGLPERVLRLLLAVKRHRHEKLGFEPVNKEMFLYEYWLSETRTWLNKQSSSDSEHRLLYADMQQLQRVLDSLLTLVHSPLVRRCRSEVVSRIHDNDVTAAAAAGINLQPLPQVLCMRKHRVFSHDEHLSQFQKGEIMPFNDLCNSTDGNRNQAYLGGIYLYSSIHEQLVLLVQSYVYWLANWPQSIFVQSDIQHKGVVRMLTHNNTSTAAEWIGDIVYPKRAELQHFISRDVLESLDPHGQQLQQQRADFLAEEALIRYAELCTRIDSDIAADSIAVQLDAAATSALADIKNMRSLDSASAEKHVKVFFNTSTISTSIAVLLTLFALPLFAPIIQNASNCYSILLLSLTLQSSSHYYNTSTRTAVLLLLLSLLCYWCY